MYQHSRSKIMRTGPVYTNIIGRCKTAGIERGSKQDCPIPDIVVRWP